MSADDQADAFTALNILKPHGQTLQAAATFFVQHMSVATTEIELSVVVDELVDAKKRDGASARYLKDLRTRLKIFASSFDEKKVREFSAALLDDWLRGLPHSAVTRNNYRRLIGILFGFAVKRGYILQNPAQKTARAKVVDKPPGILTSHQCVQLLNHASQEIVVPIALGLFAGLRPEAEVWKLDWNDIDLETGLIRIEAAKTKSAMHRLVEITENLKSWLVAFRSTGKVSPTGDKYHYLLQSARAAASVEHWPQDCLRHCYGSYHYAKFQDPGKTMVQMGHTNMRTFHAHYRARVTPSEAASYWKIVPIEEA
ncbi:MAG: site-specific integrase [Chthoniobacteraceae bacterium]